MGSLCEEGFDLGMPELVTSQPEREDLLVRAFIDASTPESIRPEVYFQLSAGFVPNHGGQLTWATGLPDLSHRPTV
jgi:hypothetical protein